LLPLFTAGMDVRHIQGFDYAQSIDASSLPPYALSVHNSGGKQLQAGVFGEAQFTPAKAWEIWPSMRFDYVRSYAGRAEDISGGGPLITTRYADNEFTQFSPKLATRYELTDAVATRASVYRSFRMPTFENLYRGFVASGFSLQPDPQTKPEKLWGGEVGLDFAQGRLHGQANLFYNKIRDQITYVPVSFFPVFTLKATNIGESDVRGVELIGDAQVTDALSFGISYSYNDARIVSYPPDPSIEGNRVPQSPAHTVSAVARYNQASGPRVELRVYYASSSFDDTSNTLRVDPRTVVDISAGYPLGKTVELFLIAQNVFDEKYVATTLRGVHYGAPLQIFGGIKATFGGR
jgi:outer membrane receptor protein involved in Fe transport